MSAEGIAPTRNRMAMELQWSPITAVLGIFLYCVLLTGCIVAPIPMTKRIEAPGEAPGRTAPDLSRLHTGQTTRQDVFEKLSLVDTGYSTEDLFFGRWVTSGSGWVWMIAGNNAGEGGYWRNWRVHNLLVTFNKNGSVKDVQEVDDGHLLKTLAGLPAAEPQTANLAVCNEMQVHFRRGLINLELEPDSIIVDHTDPPKIHLRIAPTQIASLRVLRPHHPDPASLQMRMDFQSRTAIGRKIQFTIAPSDAVHLTRYLQRVNSSATIFR